MIGIQSVFTISDSQYSLIREGSDEKDIADKLWPVILTFGKAAATNSTIGRGSLVGKVFTTSLAAPGY